MFRSSSISAQASSAKAGLKCMPLDATDLITLEDAGLCVFIVPGACAMQREVAGQWIDVQGMYRGGIVVTRLAGPFRVTGNRLAEGVALLIGETQAENQFEALMERLKATPVLQLEADAVIERLVSVLAIASKMSAPCVEEPIVEAISLRLSVISRQQAPQPATRQQRLPVWRLRRVTDLVNERLDTGISLAEMASAAGLSPMYFAAQFKVATGMRPHHYLLAQRIARAKHLLEETNDTIMDIAIAVGFQTQAHFATVFKHHENMTPRQWRDLRAPRTHAAHRVPHRARSSARARRPADLQAAG